MCTAYCIVISCGPPLAVVFKVESENPATCEVRSEIPILNVKTFLPAEIHRKVVEGYGEGTT
jgi:hypothetical protein